MRGIYRSIREYKQRRGHVGIKAVIMLIGFGLEYRWKERWWPKLFRAVTGRKPKLRPLFPEE